jgi:methylated-DNA-[protein]-cysteine S-methyltransferase
MKTTNTTTYTLTPSPVGPLTLVAQGGALIGVYFENAPRAPEWVRDDGATSDVHAAARRQLDEYFAGKRQRFELPLAPRGTPFRQAVWEQLRRIPYGETTTYGEIARALGNPAATRAVGGANHHNPISIIIPCHRVIGADGSLTGYGGELHRKKILLDLEAKRLPLTRS